MVKSWGLHGGDIFHMPPSEREWILDFSININPVGLSPKGRDALRRQAEQVILRYPDSECREVREALSVRYGIAPSHMVVGNGATELIYALVAAWRPKKVCFPVPSFSEYGLAARAAGIPTESVPCPIGGDISRFLSEAEKAMTAQSMFFLGHPNNPDGRLLPRFVWETLMKRAEETDSTVIIDESFIDFVGDDLSYRQDMAKHERLAVLMSLTKFYAVPGLRIGCIFGAEAMMDALRKQLIPWHVNGLAQLYMTEASDDMPYIRESRRFCEEERLRLVQALESMSGVSMVSGAANFILCRLTGHIRSASMLQEKLQSFHILIRNCENYEGLDDSWFRIAVRKGIDNDMLTEALRKVLES